MSAAKAEVTRSPSVAPIRALAPAKINLGLFVGARRRDGKHNLVTVMQSISLADEVVLQPLEHGDGNDELHCPQLAVPPHENLAMRALQAFREATGWSVPVRIAIAKRIPVAAGLGGGSSDAGAVLRLALVASRTGDQKLASAIARRLGADVPAQVRTGCLLARGAGERLSVLADPLPPLGVLVLPSAQRLSTASVYAQLDHAQLDQDALSHRDAMSHRLGKPLRAATELAALGRELRATFSASNPLAQAGLLVNDLQAAAIELCPQIGEALAQARESGADLALLSGSGPTVLGLFGGPHGPLRARQGAASLRLRPDGAIAALTVTRDFGRALRNNCGPGSS